MSMQPPSGEQPTKSSNTKTALIIVLAFGVLGLVCCGGLALLIFPAMNMVRMTAMKSVNRNNEMTLTMAILQYEQAHQQLPPPYVADADGKPKHSWRVLILPYIEQDTLYSECDMNEPWDGPNNIKLANRMPAVFRNPSSSGPPNEPGFLAVVGPETAWPPQGKMSLDKISRGDGASNTILLVEVDNAGFNWLEPRDLTLAEAARGINPGDGKLGISSSRKNDALVGMCDMRIVELKNGISPATLRALLTMSGGEAIDQTEIDGDGP